MGACGFHSSCVAADSLYPEDLLPIQLPRSTFMDSYCLKHKRSVILAKAGGFVLQFIKRRQYVHRINPPNRSSHIDQSHFDTKLQNQIANPQNQTDSRIVALIICGGLLRRGANPKRRATSSRRSCPT
jgi:hypothetical protein